MLLLVVIFLTVFWISLKLVTSTTLYSKLGLLISLTTLINSFSSISQIKTFAPEDKNFFAISRPKPWAPPVITAVFFF